MAHRRAALSVVVGACVLAAGCSALLGEWIVRHDVTVVNEGNTSRTVHVSIERGDSSVTNVTKQVQPAGRWVVTTLREPGDYRVVVDVERGGRLEDSYSLPLVEGDRKSFFDVRITKNGSTSGMIYWQDT